MATTVVNIKTCGSDGYDIYIGRAMPRQGLRASRFANPFRIPQDGTREQVIARYRTRLLTSPDLLEEARKLRGLRLACWCKPLKCHGDVLAEVADSDDAP